MKYVLYDRCKIDLRTQDNNGYITWFDFIVSNLHESKNEWCGRLVSLTDTEGMHSILMNLGKCAKRTTN